MSRKHHRHMALPERVKQTDYHKSNNTKNRFKQWLKEAKYQELIEMYQIYKLKLIEYNTIISKTKTLYPKIAGQDKLETKQIVKWKYNLLCNKLNIFNNIPQKIIKYKHR